MDIDGGTVVIASPYDDDNGASASGSAYVFRTDDGGDSYVEVAKLTAVLDVLPKDYFGVDVAIAGDTIVVGAHQWTTTGAGKAFVFRTTDGGATYGQVAKLTAADAAVHDSFGISVAIAGATIVVGTWGGEAAYIFHTSDGGATYVELSKLTADDAASWDDFGFSVAIDCATVVAGAYSDNPGGSAYVFGANLPTPCLLYTSPSPRDATLSRMPSSA